MAWPIIISNLSGELLGLTSPALDPITPSSPVEIPLGPDSIGARVTLPDGSVVEMPLAATGASSVTFVDTRQLGVYRAERISAPNASGSPAPSFAPTPSASPDPSASPAPPTDEGPMLFAVDLFSADESNIRPGDGARLVALGTDTALDPATAGVSRDEFWPLLVALALLFLVIEWLVYERDGARRVLNSVAWLRAPPAQGNGMSLPFAVTHPELLLVGLVLLAITLGLSFAARHHLSKGRRRLSLVLRSVILVSLVLAAGRLPARVAGRPADNCLRRRPLRQRRRSRPRIGARLRARVTGGAAGG